MAVCELLDFRCMIVSELIGSTILAVIIATILYFVIASKMKLGFDTTMTFALPILLILGMAFTGFTSIYAFGTVIVALVITWIFQEMIRNR